MLQYKHTHSSSVRICFRLHSLLVALYKTYCLYDTASPFLEDPIEEEAAVTQTSGKNFETPATCTVILNDISAFRYLSAHHQRHPSWVCDAKHISEAADCGAAGDITCHSHFTDEPLSPPRAVKQRQIIHVLFLT